MTSVTHIEGNTMKNPLELTMLEVEAMMREAGDSAPEKEYTVLMAWVHARQKYLASYVVAKQIEEIKTKKPDVSKRAARSIERDALDNAPVEFVMMESN